MNPCHPAPFFPVPHYGYPQYMIDSFGRPVPVPVPFYTAPRPIPSRRQRRTVRACRPLPPPLAPITPILANTLTAHDVPEPIPVPEPVLVSLVDPPPSPPKPIVLFNLPKRSFRDYKYAAYGNIENAKDLKYHFHKTYKTGIYLFGIFSSSKLADKVITMTSERRLIMLLDDRKSIFTKTKPIIKIEKAYELLFDTLHKQLSGQIRHPIIGSILGRTCEKVFDHLSSSACEKKNSIVPNNVIKQIDFKCKIKDPAAWEILFKIKDAFARAYYHLPETLRRAGIEMSKMQTMEQFLNSPKHREDNVHPEYFVSFDYVITSKNNKKYLTELKYKHSAFNDKGIFQAILDYYKFQLCFPSKERFDGILCIFANNGKVVKIDFKH